MSVCVSACASVCRVGTFLIPGFPLSVSFSIRFALVFGLISLSFLLPPRYHPDESQLITTGTDRKITYWDAADGSAIRIVDGSPAAEVCSLSVAPDGHSFVSGGGDMIVKLWNYEEGHAHYFGFGHSGAIKQVRMSPDKKNIVSVGAEGAVFIWKVPASMA